MTLRAPYWLFAALGLYLMQPSATRAEEPPPNEPAPLGLVPGTPLPSVNQSVADTIADHLRRSGRLRHYAIDVEFRDGVVGLSGVVTDPAQRDEALRIVQGLPGVVRVVDRLQVGAADSGIVQAQAPPPPPRLPESLPPPPPVPPPAAAVPGAPAPEAVPIFQAPAPSPYCLNPPRMPPYAWPTYAPYNNYSRVAYPMAYPYNAWPFIGPIYPFPKVPLGWRAVKLEWEDGYWWYSKLASKHDWWRMRFW